MSPSKRVPNPEEPAEPTAKSAAKKSASSSAPKSTAKSGASSAARSTASAAKAKSKSTRRRKPTPQAVARAWARQLAKKRPGLVQFVLDGMAGAYGRPVWESRLDPTSRLILTILSANSADVNAEVAFEALRDRYPSVPMPDGSSREPVYLPGWGGKGLPELPPPDWTAVAAAPLDELTDVIRPGGLANQKAPRLPAALNALIANGGDYSLDFLAQMPPLQARDWLAAIPGIGVKTASVVLLFSFGMPLMPVDRHVFRVSQRIGLLPPKCDPEIAHEYFLAMLEPDQMFEAHVGLVTHGRHTCHAQRPDCEHCPLAPRCRYFDPKAE